MVKEFNFSDVIGDVYTIDSLIARFGGSSLDWFNKAKLKDVLVLITADEVAVFPAFQFDDKGNTPEGLRDILSILESGIEDPWTWAQWLIGEHNQTSQIERLWQGEYDLVKTSAEHLAWSIQ